MLTDKKIWLVTGAAREMGVNIANAALGAGHAVVATARNADAVTAALGRHDELLAVQLDITDPASVDAAVQEAVARFRRIDVLVNNAPTSCPLASAHADTGPADGLRGRPLASRCAGGS